jgi:tetratricopeptide (TPR) repeat protein
VRNAPALDQVTTSSLEALQKYAEATRAFDLSGDYVKAAQLLREAVAKDSTFAMAYRKLGVALSNMGMPRPQIDSALSRAYQFRDRLPDKERYLTIATYYSTGPGLNRQKAAEAFQQALNIDTSDMTAAVNLAGQLRGRRQFTRAESLYTAINRSPRASQISMGNHAGTLIADGKAAEAESVYREMAKRFPAARAAQVYPVIFMYKRGQYDSAETFWKKERDNPNPIFKIGAVGNLAQYAQLRGRLKEARVLSREATALNVARGVPANPLGDSLGSASIAIWYFDEKDRGARALDAALAQVPAANTVRGAAAVLPVRRVLRARRQDGQGARDDRAVRRGRERHRHSSE